MDRNIFDNIEDKSPQMPHFEALQPISHLNLCGRVARSKGGIKSCGTFSDVYEGLLDGKHRVAIKHLRIDFNNEEETKFIQSLIQQVNTWSKLNHENVVPLLGYILDTQSFNFSYVTPWVEMESLQKYAEANPSCNKSRLIEGIINGIAYIHSQNVVHTDLKPSNILVTADGRAVITDIGMSRVINDSRTAATITRSLHDEVQWLSRESLNSSPFSKETDIWSLGMLLYYITEGKAPYQDLPNDHTVILAVYSGVKPSQPNDVQMQARSLYENLVWSMIRHCWNDDPAARPTADRLKVELENGKALISQLLLRKTEPTQTITSIVKL